MTTRAVTHTPASNFILTLARFSRSGHQHLYPPADHGGECAQPPAAISNILLNISILVIVALAQTMVIVACIDLSVGSIVGFVAMMVSFVIKENPEMSMLLSPAILLGMALGSLWQL